MTDREKAIVMAYTGACMLTGDKFQIFHKYVEKIMGRPVQTIEMGFIADEIKEKSKDDFMKLCADENLNEWIPVSEGLPEEETDVLICNRNGNIALSRGSYSTEVENDFIWYTSGWRFGKVIAWMPLPTVYQGE
jgi:hypothetical protein